MKNRKETLYGYRPVNGVSVVKPKGLSSAGHQEAVRLSKPSAADHNSKKRYRAVAKQIAVMEAILARGVHPEALKGLPCPLKRC